MGGCDGNMKGCCGHDIRSSEFILTDALMEEHYRLSLTSKKGNNQVLVKHIRSTAPEKDSATNITSAEINSQLLKDALKDGPIISLSVISGNLSPGTIIQINPQGADQSLRNAKDGITYFGCKKRGYQNPKSKIKNKKAPILNDIIIKGKNNVIAQNHRGRHFQIQYFVDKKIYKIKDLGIGYGAYAKITNPLILKDNYLLSMGESFFIVNIVPDNIIKERNKLKVKIYSGPSNGEIL